jgi:hypothetical protein
MSQIMNARLRAIKDWLWQTTVCFAFIGFLVPKCEAQLGTPPVIAVQPLGLSVLNGGTASISVTAVSLTSMEFTWCFNGKEISNPKVVNAVVPLVGTVSTLTITNISSTNQGNYSVKIQNGVGEVTSSNAVVVVLASTVTGVLNIVSSGTGMTTNGFKLNLSAPSGSNCVIEASTDLKNWTPISTNTAAGGTCSYTDTAAVGMAFRYYRARLQ